VSETREDAADDVGGWAGPWRRLRAVSARARVTIIAAGSAASVFGGAVYWGLGTLLHSGQGWFGFVFFSIWMFVIWLYQPELVRLFRRLDR
jgi:hypothetical protein